MNPVFQSTTDRIKLPIKMNANPEENEIKERISEENNSLDKLSQNNSNENSDDGQQESPRSNMKKKNSISDGESSESGNSQMDGEETILNIGYDTSQTYIHRESVSYYHYSIL